MKTIDELPTTEHGTVRKSDSMRWLENLEPVDLPDEVKEQMLKQVNPIPDNHEGTTYSTPYTDFRVTGTAEWVTLFARIVKSLTAWETTATYLKLNVKECTDDDGRATGGYAMQIQVQERGKEGKMRDLLLGSHRDNDQKVAEALGATG